MKGFAVVTLKLLLESPWNYCEILNILEIVNIIKLNFFFLSKKNSNLSQSIGPQNKIFLRTLSTIITITVNGLYTYYKS